MFLPPAAVDSNESSSAPICITCSTPFMTSPINDELQHTATPTLKGGSMPVDGRERLQIARDSLDMEVLMVTSHQQLNSSHPSPRVLGDRLLCSTGAGTSSANFCQASALEGT